MNDDEVSYDKKIIYILGYHIKYLQLALRYPCSFMGDVYVVNPKHYTTSRKTYIVALTLEMDMDMSK